MITSQTTSLSKPSDDDRIPVGTLAYFRARNRARLYDIVMQEFERSNITQATLARRLGRRPEVINRLLSAPGNWETDTASDLLFAIAAAETSYGVAYPLDEGQRNDDQPSWISQVETVPTDTDGLIRVSTPLLTEAA